MTDPFTISLVERARAGDRAAMASLWARNQRRVAATVLAHAPSLRGADLDDVVQEVAAAVVAGIGQLRDGAAWGSWLRTITVHAATSAGRRRMVAPRCDGSIDEKLVDPRSSAKGPSRSDLLDAVAALPTELREPLLLRTVDGLSQREIAAALELPVTTVETRLARARRQLRGGVLGRDHGAALAVKPGPRRAT